MGVFQNNLMGAAAAAGGAAGGTTIYDYQIANSVRMNGSDQYFNRTAGSTATNNDKKAISLWYKRTGTTGNTASTYLLSCQQDDLAALFINDGAVADNVGYFTSNGGQNGKSKFLKRDFSAWYHLVFLYDSTESTGIDRVKFYINGVHYTTADSTFWNIDNNGYPDSGAHIGFGKGSNDNNIGRYQYNGSGYYTGYLADFVMIDGGTVPSISDFGETTNGVWVPKDPSGLTFGENGCWLKFESSGDLGNDSSGNNNDWTANNFAAHDQMLDSPTFSSTDGNGGNFATLNPVYKGVNLTAGTQGTITEGNLKHSYTNAQDASCPCTIKVPPSGKWYFEWAVIAGGGNAGYSPSMGIIDPNVYTMLDSGTNTGGLIAYVNYANQVRKNGTYVATYDGSRASNGDVMGIAVDMDNGAFYASKNGTYYGISGGSTGDPTSGASKTGAGATWTPASEFTSGMVPISQVNGGNAPVIVVNFGQEGTFAGTETAGGNADGNGYGNFFTAPPTDYLAVCSGNLSAAGADPAEEKQPVNNYFQAITYTGDGNNGHSLTTKLAAASFWGKNRATGAGTPTNWWNTTGNNFGTGTELYVQFSQAGYGGSSATYQGVSNISATNVDVGNVGYINVSSSSYVAYLIGVAGAGAVTDTSGDIDSVRFTDADAGISIMDYTGSGTDGHTVPHGLGVKPSCVIIKNSTASNSSAWRVWFDAYGDYNDYGVMNTQAAWVTSSGIFSSDPTTTMLPLASGVTQNNSSQTYMAWVFANTEGMIKAGTYEGNGNADGAFIYTGSSIAFLLIKDADDNQDPWVVYDNKRPGYNVTEKALHPNTNAPESDSTSYSIDLLSNGFKLRTTFGGQNATHTYVYLAFSENPFKYATAR